jgi:uncharacterized protein YwqG
MVFWRRQKTPNPSDMRTSVILKRQVPIRFDETPRSWLGGLPMMPLRTKWPRDTKGSPLHFIAQIACADLPPQLWNGIGPRNGWLLLFVEVLKLEDEAKGKSVQVLHIDSLGPEQEPPEDMPTVRHAMSDYVDYSKPNIRRGVPKLWRKWPVDFVVQEYKASDEEAANSGPPFIPAEDLYNAPVSGNGIFHGSITLERPLTWRGALYVVEGLVRDLKPEEFERNFIGNQGGLIEPPESDQVAFNAEIKRRSELRKEFQDREIGWINRADAARAALTAELAAERRVGWIARGFAVLDAEKAKFEDYRDKEQQKLESGQGTLSQAELHSIHESIGYRTKKLAEFEQNRDHLDRISQAYPGPEGEAELNAEITRMGKAHLAWAVKMKTVLESWFGHVLAQDLDAPLPEAEWQAIEGSLEDAKSSYWQKTYDTRVLVKTERTLSTSKHIEMAVREDVLDGYACNSGTLDLLSREQIDEIEQKLRHIEECLPHRMGDMPNPVQGGLDAERVLLFQIATDRSMGWMWGDVGALYVTIYPHDLRRNRFDRLHAWIEGH